ncbi:MAG TPA: ATP-dependent DNA helicase Rep [Crenotrichaceae bacterium]|nr:ATP-dependent DNA helicase Rep [Crenotrichaceae bacterium]
MFSLNPQQKLAVNTTDRPLLVLAGAGSGKTRVITEKIVRLIEHGMAARHIAAVTFTNKAAREMKERVKKSLNGQPARGLRISTFHTLGLDIIRRERQALGFRDGVAIFDDHDRSIMLRELVNHASDRYDPDSLDVYGRQISTWKNLFIDPESAVRQAEDSIARQIAVLYAEYNSQLRAYNAVDFDDLIMIPVTLFRENAARLEFWQNRIQYLLVDEYQDTNITQYQLVKLLAGPQGRLTVVGDDDQSIYAWRGAQPENMLRLTEDFPRLQIIKLEQNYRSTQRILKAANHLIKNNHHVFEKRLWSDHAPGAMLRVLDQKDEIAETQQIAAEIIHHRLRNNTEYHDYAILYRSNHQSRLFERVLRENNIPYYLSGSASFFAYAEVKDVLAYLRLLVNQDDDCAFLRVINTPPREIGQKTLLALGNYAQSRSISLFSACFEMGLTQHLPARAVNSLTRFCEWIVDTADRAERGDTFAVIDAMLDTIKYVEWLKDNANNEKAGERKEKNVFELIQWLQRIADKEEKQKPLQEIIADIMLIDILERQSEDEIVDRVSLMTLHAAKGLEFPHVYLVGMEEELLPHKNSLEQDTLEEERRLAYVGITRAQKTLTFSYCSQRQRYGDVIDCEPSRFLSELPEEDLEWRARQPVDEQQSREHAKASIAGLKSLLSGA